MPISRSHAHLSAVVLLAAVASPALADNCSADLDQNGAVDAVDPAGPAEGFGGYRTRRGGSWGYAPGLERASARDFGNPSQGYNFVGLRVARSVDGTP